MAEESARAWVAWGWGEGTSTAFPSALDQGVTLCPAARSCQPPRPLTGCSPAVKRTADGAGAESKRGQKAISPGPAGQPRWRQLSLAILT